MQQHDTVRQGQKLSPSVVELIRAARTYLAFQAELGLSGVDTSVRLSVSPSPGKATPAPAAAPKPTTPPAVESAEAVAADEARRRAAEEVSGLSAADSRGRGPKSARPAQDQGSRAHSVRGMSDALREIAVELGECQRCKLGAGRTHVVFGAGNPQARLMFVGEGPGRDEDLQGEPIVGAAGELLDRMIKAMGLSRGEVYLVTVVKCRPPKNRDPEPDEIAACREFLNRQIRAVGPEVLVALGRGATRALLGDETPIAKLRGQWRVYEGVPLMPTYDPAYLLQNPNEKRPVWDDLRQVMKRLGLPVVPSGRGRE